LATEYEAATLVGRVGTGGAAKVGVKESVAVMKDQLEGTTGAKAAASVVAAREEEVEEAAKATAAAVRV